MKLYTYTTFSQKEILEKYFLPSAAEFDVIVKMEENDKIFNFYHEEFTELMKNRSRFYYEMVSENAGQQIILCDCDILFCKPALKLIQETLADHDLIASCDFSRISGIELCGGFIAINCHNNIIELFKKIIDDPDGVFKYPQRDQRALNHYIQSIPIKHKMFERNIFWNLGFSNRENPVWGGEPENLKGINVPSEIIIFHANFCIGIEKKLYLLEKVKEMTQTGNFCF